MSAHYGFVATLLMIMAILLFGPLLAMERQSRPALLPQAGILLGLALAMLSTNGVITYTMLTIVAFWQALLVQRKVPAAFPHLVVAATALLATAIALQLGAENIAFAAACLAFALRAGVCPLHAGVSALCRDDRNMQVRNNSMVLAMVIAHLYHIDHFAIAYQLAPALVLAGTLIALAYALIALVQTELQGLFRSSILMHAGMLLAALGAGGRGNYGAALLVAVTVVLAVGGLGLMSSALEARVGQVMLNAAPCGRARAFPRLAAAFAFFGAAGVGMPGTAGFIADDLLLHALWQESATGTVVIIMASAILAVATLNILSRGFFGPPMQSRAPDLLPRERLLALVMVLALLVLGLFPQLLVSPAETVLGNP